MPLVNRTTLRRLNGFRASRHNLVPFRWSVSNVYSFTLFNFVIELLLHANVGTDSVLVQTKNTATVRMQSSQIAQLCSEPFPASPAASTCQFIMARTRPALVLLTDIIIAAEAAVFSFCASITCACRGPLITDSRFAVWGRGLANAALKESHLV